MLRPFGRARIAISPVTFSGRWHYDASTFSKPNIIQFEMWRGQASLGLLPSAPPAFQHLWSVDGFHCGNQRQSRHPMFVESPSATTGSPYSTPPTQPTLPPSLAPTTRTPRVSEDEMSVCPSTAPPGSLFVVPKPSPLPALPNAPKGVPT